MNTAFDGYRFHRVLREGTFDATEVESGESVVIESPVGVAEDDADLREWFAEAWEVLAELDEPSLPIVRALGEQDGMPFAVREPVDGVPLPGLTADDEGLNAATVRLMTCRLADGLEQAHEAGVVHGALGPDDVIVKEPTDGERTAVLTGFGRVEGLRSDDVRGLGEIIEALLEALRAAHEVEPARDDDELDGDEDDDEEDGRSAVDEAIIAMLGRVAREAREGKIATAGALRDAVAAGSRHARGERSRRSPALAVLALLAVAALAVAAVLFLGDDDGDEPASTVASDGKGAPAETERDPEPQPDEDKPDEDEAGEDPEPAAAGQVAEPIALSGGPRGLAVRDGVVYVAAGGGKLLGVEESGGGEAIPSVDLGGDADELTVVDDVAYVTLPKDGRIAAVDLAGDGLEPAEIEVGDQPAGVIGAAGSIWVVNEGSGDLSRIDPDSRSAESVVIGASAPNGIAFGFGSLWVSDASGAILRIDPEDPLADERFEVEDPVGVLVTDDGVWAPSPEAGLVTRLDPDTGETEEFDVGGEPVDLAADPERIWVANAAGYVTSIDIANGDLGEVEVAEDLGSPVAIAVGERVWVSTGDGDELVPIDPSG